ncbi:hypothetical protein OG436_04660 [Streptomyces caniferus]|uniref:hypothetical protein n=1 Tax=Streptomyces caniferus TaxID=285557 RepID=UPI002E27EA4E|nr:hypothetical protein [Streptomyces caniferus]
MRQSTFVGSSITTRSGDAKVHGRMLPVAQTELAELLLGASQADPETFDLAEPAFRLGFGDSGDQVVADLDKPCPLGRVRSEERASDASVLVDAGGAVGAGAGADGELAAFEVTEEVFPLCVGRGAVFLGGAERAAASDEGVVGFDGLGRVDG